MKQNCVELIDCMPIRYQCKTSCHMNRLNSSFQLKPADAVHLIGLTKEKFCQINLLVTPQCHILIGERNEPTRGTATCTKSGMQKKHESGKPNGLRLIRLKLNNQRRKPHCIFNQIVFFCVEIRPA